MTGWGSGPGVAALASLAIGAAVFEELLVRGILFRIIEELVGTWAALAASAVFFGVAHLPNPDATAWGAAAIALEAGILLGAAYAVTRRLWFPIGLHLAWNFTQSGIFGVSVSGSGANQDGLLRSELTGDPILSGGAFGAEASIFAVLVCLAAGVLILRQVRATGQVRAPIWSTSRRASLPVENPTTT